MIDSVRRNSQNRHCDSTLNNKSSERKTISTGNNVDRFDEQIVAFAAIDMYVRRDISTDIRLDNDTQRPPVTKQEPYISVNFRHAQSEHRSNF
jgi:hypothetical protein